MKQGGFCLRSWNSNDQALQTVMGKDGSLAHHGNNCEKVLCLKYFMESDSIQLSDSVLGCVHTIELCSMNFASYRAKICKFFYAGVQTMTVCIIEVEYGNCGFAVS